MQEDDLKGWFDVTKDPVARVSRVSRWFLYHLILSGNGHVTISFTISHLSKDIY